MQPPIQPKVSSTPNPKPPPPPKDPNIIPAGSKVFKGGTTTSTTTEIIYKTELQGC